MGRQDNSYRWVMLIVTWMAGFVLAIPFYAYPPLLPEIMLDLDISTTEAALLMAFPSIAFSSFQIVGGLSADRLGAKKTMSLGMFLLSVFTLLSAAANNFTIELVTRLMVGVGMGLTGVCIIKVLSGWFSKRELSLAIGIQATGWAVGNATGLFFPVLLKQQLGIGWRGPIYIFGLLGCVATIIFIILARNKESASLKKLDFLVTIPNILRVREFWLLTLAQFGFMAANTAIITWLPTTLIDAGWNQEKAAIATTLIAIIGIPANLVGGIISDWWGKRKPVILISGVALSLSTALLGIVIPGLFTWPVVCVMGWFSFFFTGPFFATPSAFPEIGSERVGTLIGLMSLFSGIGGFISPIAMGILKDTTNSYFPGFLMAAGLAAFLMLPGIFGRETGISTRL